MGHDLKLACISHVAAQSLGTYNLKLFQPLIEIVKMDWSISVEIMRILKIVIEAVRPLIGKAI